MPDRPHTVLFTLPKPFEGHIGVIQRNALSSCALLQGVRTVVMGEEPGIAEACAELGLEHIPEIETNEYGTPYLDSAFARAAELARDGERVAFVNADMILGQDFVSRLANLPFRDFLVAGRRWNIDITEPRIDSPEAVTVIQSEALGVNDLGTDFSSDFFVLPRHSVIIREMPRLLVGRKAWDNWMMWKCRQRRLPLIDATRGVITVHQNHGYSHVKRADGESLRNPWDGPESRQQQQLIATRMLPLKFATHTIEPDGALLRKPLTIARLGMETDFRRENAESSWGRYGWSVLFSMLQAGNRCRRLIDKRE